MENSFITMNQLPVGKKAQVISLKTSGKERRKMINIGLIQGTTVEALHKSPSGDPIAYFIRGAVIALRSEDAKKIILSSFA